MLSDGVSLNNICIDNYHKTFQLIKVNKQVKDFEEQLFKFSQIYSRC